MRSIKTSQASSVGAALLTLATALSACGDLKSSGEIRHVAYTKDGDVSAFLAREMVTFDGNLKAEKSRVRYVGPPEGAEVNQASMSADGKVAAIAWWPDSHSVQSTVDVFSVPEREPLLTITATGNAQGLQIDPTGRFLAYFDWYQDDNRQTRSELRLYDIATGVLLWTDDKVDSRFMSVFSRDGRESYHCSHLPLSDGTGVVTYPEQVVARNAQTGAIRWQIPADLGMSSQLGLAPDDSRIISGFQVPGTNPSLYSRSIGFWRTSDGQLAQAIPVSSDDVVLYGAISVDGHFAVVLAPYSGGDDGRRLMVANGAGSVLYTRNVEFFGELAFSPDGTRILMSPPLGGTLPGAPAVIIYDTATGDEVATKRFTTDMF